ncbi:MAG: hypothetical protein GX113_02680 [Actinobacteria bacterium]|jgi:phosphoribosylaminoimidazole-succinocarboxamide synthase|nr:hypothetical protein [Actinomycetota bacterium]
MTRLEKLYEGKAKIVYVTDDPDVYIQDFKDRATAFDGAKKGTIGEKGRINTPCRPTFSHCSRRPASARTSWVSNDALHDPLLCRVHIDQLELLTPEELDELTPGTCRLWDAATREKLDKDRFRRDLGGVEKAYAEVLRRVPANDDPT